MKNLLNKFSQLFFIATMPIIVTAQNPKGFDKMAKKMAEKTVPLITTNQVLKLQIKEKKILFLDTREKDEFAVSHIKNAKHIGYNQFDISSIENIDKNTLIVVYCSVGYRSGKIGKKLREAGFTSVFNLYGGIFSWANNGNPVYSGSKEVTTVHPYSGTWGKWLKPELRSKLN